MSDSSLSRTGPVLVVSLLAAIWLGVRLGVSYDSLSERRKKKDLVTQDSPAPSLIPPRKLAKRRISQSTSRLSKDQVCVSVTGELEKAIKECKELVEAISNDCRASNRKFRDIEFDLASDPHLTFHGLVDLKDPNLTVVPAVKRVTELFDHPIFFSDRPGEHDIHQGDLGDCWLLSALSAVSTCDGFIERVCVARDEKVGVYGFVFQRNGRWTTVIIDDQLFWSLPKFEELKPEEQELFQNDKDLYKSLTHNTGRSLHHAHSGLQGETWVPLIEKAFAKLHGDFDALNAGWVSEGVEDLTGGVSTVLNSTDILDPDQFWTSELLLTNPPSPLRLIGVCFRINTSDTNPYPTVEGLVNHHAYSVLRARECRGKKFVVLRNPWGTKEWTGAWSDGSKFWTEGLGFVKNLGKDGKEETQENWAEVLKELDHVLGEDGEFVMEYKDFLETWHRIEITTLLDSSWVLSSHWLHVPSQSPVHPWAYGDVTFSFTLPYPSKVHVVLSQLDKRYFRSLSGLSLWGFDFVLYKRGDAIEEWECQGSSYSGLTSTRSVSWQGELQPGEYIVWPRLDRWDLHNAGSFADDEKKWDPRKLGRVLMNRTITRTIASNYESLAKKRYIPKTASDVIIENRTEVVPESGDYPFEPTAGMGGQYDDNYDDDGGSDYYDGPGAGGGGVSGEIKPNGPTGVAITGDDEDARSLWLGLKVYTTKHEEETVVIEGWVKDDDDRSS